MGKIKKKDVEKTFSRSGGAGGQNVNKVATKATLHLDVKDCGLFSEEEEKKLLDLNICNNDGELVVSSSATRSQKKNLKYALEKLNLKVEKALKKKKKRIPTKAPGYVDKQRLENKRHRKLKKKRRKKVRLRDYM